MVSLFCAIVDNGRIFSVKMDLSETVAELKLKIKETNPEVVQCDAGALTLYLAKRNGKWLHGDDDDVQAVRTGTTPDAIRAMLVRDKKMAPVARLSSDEYFGPNFVRRNKDIHVLVQVPPSRKRRFHALAAYDGSAQWIESFCESFGPPSALPSLHELAAFVTAPLPVKLELTDEDYRTVWNEAGSEICDKLFTCNDNEAPCTTLWQKVFSRVLSPGHVGTTTSAFHKFWDTFMMEPLATVLDKRGGSVDRGLGTSTSKDRLWPAMFFTFKDICVFRGEETAPRTTLSVPTQELQDKIHWSFGTDVPYVFGYAAAGYDVALYAIVSSPDQTTVRTEPILSVYTQNTTHRFKVVLALLQLGRLFSAIERLCADTARHEFAMLHRTNGLVLRLNATAVERDFTLARAPDGGPVDVAQLQLTYGTIKEFRIPYMERLTKTSACGCKFTFEPRGVAGMPQSLEELFCALQCVLTALVRLHEKGWMHRDLRWDNVMKSRDTKTPTWFLIDLADATPSPQASPSGQHLSRSEHAPEIFVAGSHTTAADIWSVGQLILQWERQSTSTIAWKDDPSRRAYREALVARDPTARPTAARALEQLNELGHKEDERNAAAERPRINESVLYWMKRTETTTGSIW